MTELGVGMEGLVDFSIPSIDCIALLLGSEESISEEVGAFFERVWEAEACWVLVLIESINGLTATGESELSGLIFILEVRN